MAPMAHDGIIICTGIGTLKEYKIKWSATPIFGGSWRAPGEEAEDTNITEESEPCPLQDSTSPVKNSPRSPTPSKPIAPYSLVSRLRPALYPEKIGQNHPLGLEKQSRRSVAP
ncbi:hypothetical protein ACJJTC_000136 [Scirpophaga incertulas]